MHCFTSITNNYFPKARILAKTLKRHNPGWRLHVVLSEPLHPSVNPAEEPFDSILNIEQLGIENLPSWLFKHKVTEICTAVKGRAALHLINKLSLDKIVYFDPDIVVFNDLTELALMLDHHPIILAPHQSKPEATSTAIEHNEIGSLRWGVFNLGFFAVRGGGQGLEFLHWWTRRLMEFCYDDIPFGLFTDQRWCDLAPVFFDRLHILRDSEYDVATWNLTERKMGVSEDGTVIVDGKPLRFYHFSGYDSDAGLKMVQYLFPDRTHVIYDIWNWYLAQLERNGQAALGAVEWAFDRFSNGQKVEDAMRVAYRSRWDLQHNFPNPFLVSEPSSFYSWWLSGGREEHQRAKSSRPGLGTAPAQQ